MTDIHTCKWELISKVGNAPQIFNWRYGKTIITYGLYWDKLGNTKIFGNIKLIHKNKEYECENFEELNKLLKKLKLPELPITI